MNKNFVPEIMGENMEGEKIPGYKEDTCIVYIKEEDVKEETPEIQGI